MFAHHSPAGTSHSRSSIIGVVFWTALALGLLAATMQLAPGNLSDSDFKSDSVSADAATLSPNASVLEPFLVQEPTRIDSASQDDPNMSSEPTPAPLAMAAYD